MVDHSLINSKWIAPVSWNILFVQKYQQNVMLEADSNTSMLIKHKRSLQFWCLWSNRDKPFFLIYIYVTKENKIPLDTYFKERPNSCLFDELFEYIFNLFTHKIVICPQCSRIWFKILNQFKFISKPCSSPNAINLYVNKQHGIQFNGFKDLNTTQLIKHK